jgi:hypothetical protein
MIERLFCMVGVLCAVSGAVLSCAAANDDTFSWESFLGHNDLVWDRVGDHWTKGPFIGNGEMGALIYHEKAKDKGDGQWLRFELSRTDLYTAFATNYSIRMPTGHVYLKPAGKVKASRARLDLWNAEATGVIETEGGKITWRAFVHAPGNLLYIELKTEGDETGCKIEYEAERAIHQYLVFKKQKLDKRNEQPEPVVSKRGDTTVSVQPWWWGGGAATATREIASGGTRVLVASLAVNWADPAPADVAHAAVNAPSAGEIVSARVAHREWWHAFYRKSFLSIPDARLESFYWIQLYKMASATREDRAAVDLMGPWYQMTMWPKYWMNLNIQLAYYPVYEANHLELGLSLVNWVSRQRASLIANAPKEWQYDSAALPRATGLDLRGDVRNDGKELGNLMYLLHNVYLQYRYSMDDKMLRDVLYPLLTRSVNFYRHVLIKKDDGKYHLPRSISPEYGPAEDCNYDLSLLRWGCGVLIESAERLKLDDPLIPVWKDILANLTPYPVDKNGLMIGSDVPFAKSHRHYSHLFMIYPLAIMQTTGVDGELARKSMDYWLGMTEGHTGFSYTGGGSIAAYMGDGDRALKLMNIFCDKYLKPNTFYTELWGWPVIETPLSGARTLQEMVLQSHAKCINVFPAVPAKWENVTFRDLRTEGAFLVSAVRAEGKTKWIRIQSLAGEPCVLKTDMANPVFCGIPQSAVTRKDGFFQLAIPKGGAAALTENGMKEPVVMPVKRIGVDHPWGSCSG